MAKSPEEILARIDKLMLESSDDPNIKRRRIKVDPKPAWKNNGGWRGNPNSLLALELHRARTQFGAGGLRLCNKCKRVAVRGLNVCYRHGGARLANKRRIEAGCFVRHRPSAAGSLVNGLLRQGALPVELVRNSVFKAVGDESRRIEELRKAGEIDRADVNRLRACRLLHLELVQAWMMLAADEKADAAVWRSAVSKVREIGLIP